VWGIALFMAGESTPIGGGVCRRGLAAGSMEPPEREFDRRPAAGPLLRYTQALITQMARPRCAPHIRRAKHCAAAALEPGRLPERMP